MLNLMTKPDRKIQWRKTYLIFFWYSIILYIGRAHTIIRIITCVGKASLSYISTLYSLNFKINVTASIISSPSDGARQHNGTEVLIGF